MVQGILHPENFAGLDVDVCGLALEAARRLVEHDAGVGQGEAFALGPGGQQKRSHAGGLPDADGRDIGPDVLHRVVDGEPAGDNAPGGVDVDVNVLGGLIGL